jgi:hypothetical protein
MLSGAIETSVPVPAVTPAEVVAVESFVVDIAVFVVESAVLVVDIADPDAAGVFVAAVPSAKAAPLHNAAVKILPINTAVIFFIFVPPWIFPLQQFCSNLQ